MGSVYRVETCRGDQSGGDRVARYAVGRAAGAAGGDGPAAGRLCGSAGGCRIRLVVYPAQARVIRLS